MGGMKRGITLPELLVAMGLLGLLTGLVYPVMYATVRHMQRSDADVRSQQKAVLLVQKFFADFALSRHAHPIVPKRKKLEEAGPTAQK